MEVPLSITFRNVDRSEWIEQDVRSHVDKLDEIFDHITSCKVVIEAPHKHHRHGNLYRVQIHLSVPRKELTVNKDKGDHPEHADLHIAIRDAFLAMRRQVEAYARELRGDMKTHETPPHGRVAKLDPDKNCGFIETPDGRTIYFHQNSLLDTDYEQLKPGTEVRFVEEDGDKGPQATSVRLVGRHNHL
ncbi:MAG: HPF/RaiA family ribosome-associated protein [Planctomycetes bacterium]|nr:HPF/RaiA family ribosome-associated protein [Planctomycetota bacterium]